jgi:hypothetical protein
MEIHERTFKFAIRIVKLCQYLDEKQVNVVNKVPENALLIEKLIDN